MSQYYSLLSIVFMMSVVVIFDKVHFAKVKALFFKNGLMTEQDIDRMRAILSACQES